ncbi:MAG: reverse transcriptase family protein, partial [Candidatus Thiodiazotropha sp.]
YKLTRNKVTAAIRKAKTLETEKLAQKLRNNNINSKDWWKTLKNFIKPGQTSSIPPLCKDDAIYSDPNDKANIFNIFFTEQTMLDETNASLPSMNYTPASTLSSVSTTPLEVESIFKSLKTGKAAGPDCINNRLLKEVATALSFPVCDLFNFSLANGKVPSLWKQANVTPIHKKNDPSDFSNYRPISLLSTIGKSLEKIIHKHVFNFLRANTVLTNLQSGFIPADSTVNQLVDIYNTFCKALDEGKEVRAIFCDVSKAFDRVWHQGLLFKLKSVGITDSLLDWFEDYLSNRKQRVVLPGATSRWTNIKAGVPQGSILGPLLFLVYINDIVDDIDSSIRLFADDTSLYIIVENPIQAAIQLNEDLEKVHQWASKWLVTFNPTKTESLLFTRKQNRPYHPPVSLNNNVITEVTNHKHLGVTFSSDCTWHEHLDSVKEKAWFRINIMRKLKFTLDRMSLQTIYFSFIRPLLEYADVVWNNCTQYETSELDKIQNEAARIVTGATKLVSINSLTAETGWEPLAKRRKKHKLQLFYKMQNDLSPDYLSALVPPTVGSTSSYQLRNASDVHLIHANTQLYYNSFLPSVTREWNELSQDLRDSNSLSSFKRKLNADVTKPPAYFNSGSRLGQIHHARLRTHCSSLNEHLFSKNIVDSPLCVCGEVENTHHYLFDCARYDDQRRDLLNAVSLYCEPTINVLLFGNPALTLTQNQQIFTAVQDYLINSKRFQVN